MVYIVLRQRTSHFSDKKLTTRKIPPDLVDPSMQKFHLDFYMISLRFLLCFSKDLVSVSLELREMLLYFVPWVDKNRRYFSSCQIFVGKVARMLS